MFLLNFIRYLRGYVYFEAKGDFVERFLNLVARERIAVWSGRKRGDCYSGCVAAGDYRRLRKHAKKTGVRLRVTGKKGLPFQRRRYRKRTGLLVGLAVFFAFIVGMGQFIWRIEINGAKELSDVTVLQALAGIGIEPGTLRRSINVRESERRMLLLVPDLAWIALNIDGSAIHVELRERVEPPEVVESHKPCNVLAAEAGQIVEMHVYNGQPMVKIGDTVLPGDIIVSGITQDLRGQSLFRHARADVYAVTQPTLEVAVPLAQSEFVPTGQTVKRGYLGIFGLELPVFLPWKIPAPYRVERTARPLTVFSAELPVSWLGEEYICMEERPLTLTEEQAKNQALRELENLEAVRFSGDRVLERSLSGALENDSFVLTARYVCRENIGLEREILVQNGN